MRAEKDGRRSRYVALKAHERGTVRLIHAGVDYTCIFILFMFVPNSSDWDICCLFSVQISFYSDLNSGNGRVVKIGIMIMTSISPAESPG